MSADSRLEAGVPAVEFRNITKAFGTKVIANKNVSLTVRRGEILSLLGENGSGKTTLMNMLSGIYYPDEGEILVNGRPVNIHSPGDAFRLGIGMIHQHFKLIEMFTATENVVLGLPGGLAVDMKKAAAEIKAIADKYGFEVEPERHVYDMSVSEKQTLEIIKVLYRGADVLILDEPTAVLTPQETDKLFAVLRKMREDGKSIIIITHKLNEVLAISDRVSILRRGEYVGTVETKDASEQILTEMMVGKRVVLDIDRAEPRERTLRLDVKHVTVKNDEGVTTLDDASFQIFGGEILGIAGISGCGQKELLEAIAGLQMTTPGASVLYTAPGKDTATELIGKTPKQIRDLGVGLSFVPEDRLGMGLVASMGMSDNMMLKKYGDGKSPFVDKKNPKKLAEEIREDLGVVTPGLSTPVRRLSGGNVQKVLVGREIAAAPAVLMTAYAVRGLDINTSYVIYRLLNEQKAKGVAVVYVGEDLDVLLALSDRILVLCGGKVNGILDARTTTKEEVGYLMTRLAGEDRGEEAPAEASADEAKNEEIESPKEANV